MIRSYLSVGEKLIMVSTINRQSSCLEGGTYAETMAWEVNPKNPTERISDALLQLSSGKDDMTSHFKAIERLRE